MHFFGPKPHFFGGVPPFFRGYPPNWGGVPPRLGVQTPIRGVNFLREAKKRPRTPSGSRIFLAIFSIPEGLVAFRLQFLAPGAKKLPFRGSKNPLPARFAAVGVFGPQLGGVPPPEWGRTPQKINFFNFLGVGMQKNCFRLAYRRDLPLWGNF